MSPSQIQLQLGADFPLVHPPCWKCGGTGLMKFETKGDGVMVVMRSTCGFCSGKGYQTFKDRKANIRKCQDQVLSHFEEQEDDCHGG